MAREFPRFLFSNPKNTKSKGPFVVHTLHPKFIVRIDTVPFTAKSKHLSTQDGRFVITFLEETKYSDELRITTDALFSWLRTSPEVGEWLDNR